MNFRNDGRCCGNTSTNTIGFGFFTLNNSETVLIFYHNENVDINQDVILECTDTEVAEPDLWSSLFREKLYLNYNAQTENIESGFELSGNIFKLYYSENEYMKFERIE